VRPLIAKNVKQILKGVSLLSPKVQECLHFSPNVSLLPQARPLNMRELNPSGELSGSFQSYDSFCNVEMYLNTFCA
jgi:hypothetical protein